MLETRSEERQMDGPRDDGDVSVIGRGAHVEGTLVSTGSLRIYGHVKGEISAEGEVAVSSESEVEADINAGSISLAGHINGNLTAPGAVNLPPRSRVDGDVRAKSVLVQGSVKGNVVAEGKVELGPGADVVGDLRCTSLVVAEGAVFRGRSIMGDGAS
jgi:cytoskeletal protein CcmA (bactofilin family)